MLHHVKYLGIDYGTKRIGLALSDEEGKVAFPAGVIASGSAALAKVSTIATEKKVAAIVMGESRDFRDKPNPLMEDIRKFKKELAELTGLPVEYEQEFMTSVQAARQGKDKRGEGTEARSLDASAAALILQSYLDRKR